jgi:hypothetical protein
MFLNFKFELVVMNCSPWYVFLVKIYWTLDFNDSVLPIVHVQSPRCISGVTFSADDKIKLNFIHILYILRLTNLVELWYHSWQSKVTCGKLRFITYPCRFCDSVHTFWCKIIAWSFKLHNYHRVFIISIKNKSQINYELIHVIVYTCNINGHLSQE